MAETTPSSRTRHGVLIALCALAIAGVGSGALGGLSYNHTAHILLGCAALFSCIAFTLGLVFLAAFQPSRTERALQCMAFGAIACASFAGWFQKPSIEAYAVAIPAGVVLGLAIFVRHSMSDIVDGFRKGPSKPDT